MRRRQRLVRCTRALRMLTVLAACNGSPTTGDDLATVDSAGVRITTIARAPSTIPEWRLAPAPERVLTGAESGDSAALSFVGAVRWLADGGLVIADVGATRLLIYDSTGAYRRTLGRRGAGPGEFRDVSSVSVVAGDTFTTFDGSLRRLSIWHPTTGFIRQIGLVDAGSLEAWPADAWLWQDSLVVVLQLAITPRPAVATGETVRRWPMRAHLTLRDQSGRVLRTSPTFDGMYTGIFATGDTRLPFSNEPFVAVARDRVYFGSGATFRLSYVTAEFVLGGEVRWPTQQEELTRAEIEQVREEAYELMVQRLPPERARARLAMNFLPEILPEHRPEIGRVLIDPDQRLWVERFEALRLGSRLQKPGDRWTVLAPDGKPIARLLLPPNTRLEGIRGDRVAVVQRDSLDIQTVAIYSLSRP